MAMNFFHRRLCASEKWAKGVDVALTEWLKNFSLGDNAVEIGPGYGATTRVLERHCERLTAIEIDPTMAAGLRRKYGDADRVTVIEASGTDVPLPSNEASSVVCFTMLHHIPTPERQDQVFGEAYRLLRPGAWFAGVDGQDSFLFRLIHLGDTLTIVPPRTLPDRLRRAGFIEVEVLAAPGESMKFRGRKPLS